MVPKVANATEEYIQDEFRYGAHNYHPLPVVLKKGKGIYVWDVEGKKYIDFLSAYSAVNQGHSNAKIVKALTDQSNQLSLTSRAFHNDKFSQFAKMATSYFGFDMMLPMNTGAEAVETAIKLARKWGVQKKELQKAKLRLLFAKTIFMAEQRRLFRSPLILFRKKILDLSHQGLYPLLTTIQMHSKKYSMNDPISLVFWLNPFREKQV